MRVEIGLRINPSRSGGHGELPDPGPTQAAIAGPVEPDDQGSPGHQRPPSPRPVPWIVHWASALERWITPVEPSLPIVVRVARVVRTLLQMAIGAAIIVRVGFVAADVIASYPLTIGSEPLRSVGIGLLFSTAVELAYLLYTHGPDEAIDPVVTGVAALLL